MKRNRWAAAAVTLYIYFTISRSFYMKMQGTKNALLLKTVCYECRIFLRIVFSSVDRKGDFVTAYHSVWSKGYSLLRA